MADLRRALTASGASRYMPRQREAMSRSLRGSARVDTLGAREAARLGGQASGGQSKVWQQQAWAYYDEIGELRYTMNLIGACLSRCTLTLGIRDDEGHVGPVFDEDGEPLPGMDQATEALGLIQALRSQIGGQAQLLRAMGINLGVAGEFHLVGTPPEGRDAASTSIAECTWEALSTEEFRRAGDDYERISRPGATPVAVPGDSVHVIRIWRSHPRYSELPDSAVRAVLDILEELQLLTREVRGEALSRIPNGGMLLMPEEIEYPDDDADDGEGAEGDPFVRDLIQTMATAVADKGSASQTVPFVLRGPGDQLERIRLIELRAQHPSDSMAKRQEAVQRFAQGIDLPVEMTTGHAGTTFANAVSIDDSTYKAHIEPMLEIICDALTVAFLRPALGGGPDYVVHFDSVELVSRPNRAQDAKDLFDRYALSEAALRAAVGFSDTDAPDEDELAKRIEIKQLTQVRQSIPTTPGALQAETKEIDTGAPIGGAPGAPVVQGPIDSGNNTDKTLTAALGVAAELAVKTAIKQTGARLRGRVNTKHPHLRAQLQQVPDSEIMITLGPTLLDKLSGHDELFKGQFEMLRSMAMGRTGSRVYADALVDVCEDIAREQMLAPRQPFPLDRLPLITQNVAA